MKKIILIGNVACGKTTICQYLNHMEIKYKKTQALEVYNTTIDTPGEYLENRGYLRSLMVTATETDQVVFVQDASRDQFFFSPGQSSAFTLPVAGVVTKIDIATPKQIADAVELLQLAGADPIFKVSPMTGEAYGRTGGFSGGERGCSESMIKRKSCIKWKIM
ncbi:MAG: EutP/PduV family microcompartment system protein [Coprococcus sp.]